MRPRVVGNGLIGVLEGIILRRSFVEIRSEISEIGSLVGDINSSVGCGGLI